jgi:hypothetical protein
MSRTGRPAIGDFVSLADPHLVLAPHLYRCAGREFRAHIRHAGGEVFFECLHGLGILLVGPRLGADMREAQSFKMR